MNNINDFDGFMPVIQNVTVSSVIESLGSNGEIMNVNCIKITTAEGKEFIFSITPLDLHRLHLLIVKALLSDI